MMQMRTTIQKVIGGLTLATVIAAPLPAVAEHQRGFFDHNLLNRLAHEVRKAKRDERRDTTSHATSNQSQHKTDKHRNSKKHHARHPRWQALGSISPDRHHGKYVIRAGERTSAIRLKSDRGRVLVTGAWAVVKKGRRIPLLTYPRVIRKGDSAVFHLPREMKVKRIIVETKTRRRHHGHGELTVSMKSSREFGRDGRRYGTRESQGRSRGHQRNASLQIDQGFFRKH